MRGKIVRRILVVLIIIIPVFINTDCKKQAKCGCDGDVLFTLTKEQAKVYFPEGGATITFQLLSNPYDNYYFCNPGEMYAKLGNAKSGDVLLVSGSAFWECNYVQQSSNNQYSQMYKVYNCQVTDVYSDLYGK
jgi:hypothetical protein